MLKKERADLEGQYQQKIDSKCWPNLADILTHINLKTNEVNNLRYLARCILSQKGELDKFFLETIELLKEG